MKKLIGIRKEDKNIWEKRAPVVPEDLKELKDNHNIDFIVQTFPNRTFTHEEYRDVGAAISDDISEAPFVFAVKEIPVNRILPRKVYMFFSHTIKGQSYNMPLLQKIIDEKSTLIDYETITDEKGRRLVFFGRYAGLAGMVETIHGMGQRFKYLGFDTPFLHMKQAYQYKDIEEAKSELALIASEIESAGLPEELLPLTVGFAGYGNVSQGAQDVFDVLPFKEISPEELQNVTAENKNTLYKVVFKEEDMVAPVDPEAEFVLHDYYDHPEKYVSKFEKYAKDLKILVNAIFWNENYPRIVTKKFVKETKNSKLDIICDISCDINGSIEFTEKATEPDEPAFVYDPESDSISDGFEGKGIVDIAVDNLPAELPKNASKAFSKALLPFIPGIVNADYELPFDQVNLPPEIKRAVIVYKGEITPDYKYLEEFLN